MTSIHTKRKRRTIACSLRFARGCVAPLTLGRSAVEVSIEKYEKTAMQWPQEQTKNN